MVYGSLAKACRIALFYSVIQEAVDEYVTEFQSVDAVMTRMIDAPAFTIPVAKSVKHEIKKSSLAKAKMEERLDKLAETVDDEQTNMKDGIPTKSMDSVQSQVLQRTYPTASKPNLILTVQQRL